MSVVLCESGECEVENDQWEYRHGTYWFTCKGCGYENEVVEDNTK